MPSDFYIWWRATGFSIALPGRLVAFSRGMRAREDAARVLPLRNEAHQLQHREAQIPNIR